MAPIEFYHFSLSPPARAVNILAEHIGLKMNKHALDYTKNEHKSAEFLKINPQGKVPVIVDGDLKLGESRAIMAYLVAKYKPDDQVLYPKDPVKRALVDELLYYDAGTLSPATTKLIYPVFFDPTKELNPVDEEPVKVALNYIDKVRLAGDKRFLLGDQVTIADISIFCTLGILLKFYPLLKEYKNIMAYYGRLETVFPEHESIK